MSKLTKPIITLNMTQGDLMRNYTVFSVLAVDKISKEPFVVYEREGERVTLVPFQYATPELKQVLGTFLNTRVH